MIESHASSSASVASLWSVCSDVSNWPQHLDTFTSVEPLDNGPTGVGSRFAVTQPGLPGATYEITEWQPGNGFTWEAKTSGVRTTATHEVTTTESGSRVALGIHWSGPLAWLVRLSMSRKTQRMIEVEATTLASVAESAQRAGNE